MKKLLICLLLTIFLSTSKAQVENLNHTKIVARFKLDSMVMKDEFEDKIWKDGKLIDSFPDWNRSANVIAERYGRRYADSITVGYKVRFFGKVKNWSEYVKAYDEKISIVISRKKPASEMIIEASRINNAAYLLFKECNDTMALRRALEWARLALTDYAPDNWLTRDTYATLLYKLGQFDLAMKEQLKAFSQFITSLRQDPNSILFYELSTYQYFKDIITKMKERKPIW